MGHRFADTIIYQDVNFTVSPGKVYALLGKNGVGKTTLIKILMGFLRPLSGQCRVFGENSHELCPETRANIGLLFEGHLVYDFMTIGQIEKFYSRFYPQWQSDVYYELVGRLGLSKNHLIRHMSCGQRSQLVLGLIMAQQADLLILDDYSIGLDAGYRRLFVDQIREYISQGQRTVFLTSHLIQDMADFVDKAIFLERGGELLVTSLEDFQKDFHCYRMVHGGSLPEMPDIEVDGFVVKNVEYHSNYLDVFSFEPQDRFFSHIRDMGEIEYEFQEISLGLEDGFIGYTGRY